jgi:hypothetical protein
MKINKMGIVLIFLFVFLGKLFAQENFSEKIYSSYEKEIYISRDGYNIYIVRNIYRDDRSYRDIYVLTIELDYNEYLNFRYSPRGGVYAIDYITHSKIERGTLYMKFISSYQDEYTRDNELNISSDFDNFEFDEQINIYFGRGEKRYGVIYEEPVYYQYVLGGPNSQAIFLRYIIDGYIVLGNEKHVIPSDALRSIQDFALIMDVNVRGLR